MRHNTSTTQATASHQRTEGDTPAINRQIDMQAHRSHEILKNKFHEKLSG
ncbi:hypothetical protein PSEUDO8Z_100183 [Pseudomonas sp. 8Z]|nr:hypothetical protein PSEUDO8Z_100183 [Pseudomonas sp. 8Z]